MVSFFSWGLMASFLISSFGTCKTAKLQRTRLFERQSTSYPQIDAIGPTPKKEWVTAYESEKKADRIPHLAPSIRVSSYDIRYNSGVNPMSPSVCSWTMGCISPADINDAPAGMMGISFDDGPQQATSTLLSFLKRVNQSATHFMIGSRILENKEALLTALKQGDHIACHTWSHPMMTSLSDHAILGEIGWTLQLIFDLSGRLPAYWRPPYGDVDNRVRSIAKNVFGLQTVIWNRDTNDWCLTPQDKNTCGSEGPANEAALTAEMAKFLKLPKSPGLIILEHELTTHSVAGFVNSWTAIKAAGWDTRNIPSLFDQPWYQNANGPFDVPINLPSLVNISSTVAAARATMKPSTPTNQTTTQSTPALQSPVVEDRKRSGSSRATSLDWNWWILTLVMGSIGAL